MKPMTFEEWRQDLLERGEPLPECGSCEGSGSVVCDECDGTGDHECSCGHIHNCNACKGGGVVKCDDCDYYARRAYKKLADEEQKKPAAWQGAIPAVNTTDG